MQSIKVKVLTVFMSLVMAVAMFPALSSNAATQNGNCGAQGSNVKFTLTNDGTLTLSGSGDMKDFIYDSTTDVPWYKNRSFIKKVVVENGITRIGNYSFVWCTGIESVEFRGTTLKSIGSYAFYESANLKKIAFPAGLASIGKLAFCYSGLTAASFPSSLRTIGYGAFADCHLVSIWLPGGVNTIGDFAFRGNKQLVKVTGGAGLKTIGVQAFEHCWKLNKFVITSKKLKKIGKACFLCDSKLKTLSIKKTTKLTKKGVKNSLYLSSVKKVKVKKSKVKKYRKYFTYRNCAKRGVKVKK
ncbi:MAG: leucine-rich repeat domain-containing protein [Saccharofermentans sp.]|nr:leucine-rich repeat domain-containing protein [Saccharofermentans sp.]